MISGVFRTRNLLVIVALLAIGVVAALAAAWTRPEPRIVVEPAMQDLGERPQQHLELEYTVRNEGTALLRIDSVTTTCGCTKAAVERSDVAPGASTTLQVTMDPQQLDIYGNLFRAIYIHSNDPATPKAEADFRVSIPKP